MTAPPPPPPGWYPDPSGAPGRRRYFDGQQWTESYAPPPTAPPVKKQGISTGQTIGIVLGALGAGVLVLIIIIALVSGGDHVADGKFSFTVTGVEELDSVGSSEPRGRFVVVDVTVKNVGKDEESFQVNDQWLIGSNGAKYRADWVAASSINEENTLWVKLGPGFSADYRLPFDLPLDVTPAKIELHDNSDRSRGSTVRLG